MGRRSENPKKLLSTICGTKVDYGCQLYNIASPWRLKKLDSIHWENLRIYTGAFRTSRLEVLYVEANDPSLELKKDKLGLRHLYKLKNIHRDNKYTGPLRGLKL